MIVCIKKHIILLLLAMIYCPISYAQDDIIDHQVWFDVIPHFEINNRLEYFGDMSYRTSTSGDKFRRFVLKPMVRYHWTYELDLIGGLGLFLTGEEENYNTVELRPYQGVRLNWPKIWRMNFKHRGLVEERLLWSSEGDYDQALRFRYRIKTKFPISKPNIQYKTVYIPFNYEMFANGGGEEVEHFQNRARAMLSPGYVLLTRRSINRININAIQIKFPSLEGLGVGFKKK